MKIDNINIALQNQNNYLKSLNYSNVRQYFSPVFNGKSDIFVKSAENSLQIFDTNISKKLLEIFDRNLNKLPKGLSLSLSQTNSSILAYSKETEDNTIVRAIKKTAADGKNALFYVVFKEVQNGIIKDSFAVDMKTGELIKLKSDGRVSIIKNDFVKYKEGSDNKEYQKHCQKIKTYAKAIFGKDFSNSETKITSAEKIIETEEKRVWRIENSSYDNLPKEIQADIIEINNLLTRLSELYRSRRGLSSKIVQLKMDYEPLIYQGRKQKNTMFKYRNLESLSVLNSKSNQRFTRIIHTNANGIETHLLIDNTQKVVSNLNKKRPWITPEKYRYMTQKEIEASNVKIYADFLKKQLSDYYNYLNESIGGTEVSHRVRKKNSKDTLTVFMDKINKKIADNIEEIKGNIKEIADNDAKDLAAEYFKALYDSFDKYSEENFKNFQNKFKQYVDEYTKTES